MSDSTITAPAATEGAPTVTTDASASTPATPPKSFVVSQIAKAEREKRELSKRVKELESKPTTSRDQILAELKAQYESDPDSFLKTTVGEDFFKLSERLAAKQEPPTPEQTLKTLADKMAALEAKEAEARKAEEAKAEAEADERTKGHIQKFVPFIEAKDEEGNPRFPTLATLDPEVADVPQEAHDLVAYTWDAEGKPKWDENTLNQRALAAVAALENHYARFRQPKSRNQNTEAPAEPTATIHSSFLPSTRAPRAKASGSNRDHTEVLMQLLREAGLPESL